MHTSDVFPEEQHSIIFLLPYSENAQVKNKLEKLSNLYFIKTVVAFALTALETFITGNLKAFDAQVGENLCQIRAYKIIRLSEKWLDLPCKKQLFINQVTCLKEYNHKLEITIAEWENAIQKTNFYRKDLDRRENLEDFLTRNQLSFSLSEDFIFIIASAFLTSFNTCDNHIPVAINLTAITEAMYISKYRAKRLTHKYQQLICKISCKFILEIAKEFPHPEIDTALLNSLCRLADEGRQVLPCFMVSQIIFYNCIKKEIPIIFIIQRLNKNREISESIYFVLKNKQNDEEYELTLVPSEQYLNHRCLVVIGESHHPSDTTSESTTLFVQRILQEKPLQLILANIAIHPQYSGKVLASFRASPFETAVLAENISAQKHQEKLLAMQHLAKSLGCSKQSPTTFLLSHIYASSISEEIKRCKEISPGAARDALRFKS